MRQVVVLSLLVATYFVGFTPFDSLAAEPKLTKPERVGMSSERLERIGIVMRKLIDEEKIPGTVTLVARKGKVVHFEANGLLMSRGLPMQTDTIFRLYSHSKTGNRCGGDDFI